MSLPWAVAASFSDTVKLDMGSAIPVEYADLCITSHEKRKKVSLHWALEDGGGEAPEEDKLRNESRVLRTTLS